MIPVIHEWSTCFASNNPYAPPEARGLAIQGKVYGREGWEEGGQICTSNVVSVDGRTVKTRSGSTYRLGRIAPAFREWLRKQGREYDPRNPIKDRAVK